MMAQKCVHLAQTWRWKCVHQRVTTHVETVVLLSQLRADDYIEVDLDLDELDIAASEKAEPISR